MREEAHVGEWTSREHACFCTRAPPLAKCDKPTLTCDGAQLPASFPHRHVRSLVSWLRRKFVCRLGRVGGPASCGVPWLRSNSSHPCFLFCTASSAPHGQARSRQRDGWAQGHEALAILVLSTGMDGLRCRNQVCACCIAPSHGHIDTRTRVFHCF